MSTRNTKPNSVTSSSSLMTRLPNRSKNSPCDSRRGRGLSLVFCVSPSCSNTKIKSMSDETFSSLPANLPMPITHSGIGVPSSRNGSPCISRKVERHTSSAYKVLASANALMVAVTTVKCCSSNAWFKLYSINASITCARVRRKATPAAVSASWCAGVFARNNV